MPGELCRKCGRRLDKLLLDNHAEYHPTCEKIPDQEVVAETIRQDLIDIIRWTDNNSDRSQQRALGPSELGEECTRKLSYRLLEIPPVNHWTDPWPAIVGTSIHAWLEKAINSFQRQHYMDRWLTETVVHPDPAVTGHADLYDKDLRMVIDFKTVSPDKLKTWKKSGPPENYLDQINLYAKGFTNAGFAVDWVCLIALPRSGFLTDLQVWIGRPDSDRVTRVVKRLYQLAGDLNPTEGVDFSTLPAAPGRGCSFCRWYRGGSAPADARGCPGAYDNTVAKYGTGLVKPVEAS